MIRTLYLGLIAATLMTASILSAAEAKADRVFEMRTYITHDGRLDALNARFRNHTNKLFVKHGMDLVGYWVPTNEPDSTNTLVYILAYPSMEAREASWKAFVADEDWKKAKTASEADGPIVKKVISQFLKPTDYSPIK
jgi:hypothetical protein